MKLVMPSSLYFNTEHKQTDSTILNRLHILEETDNSETSFEMLGGFQVKEESNDGVDSGTTFSSSVGKSTLNRDVSRSAFTPYRPTTVLTNLQRGNVQTHTASEPQERSIHQLAAQGELLLQNTDMNFDVNKRDVDGLTPIMWAASYGQLETVRKLISCGASIGVVGNIGTNALILASISGHGAIVRELINNGADVDYKDSDGNTALMYSACNNHACCVQELLTAGADLTLVNESLDSAYDISIKRRSKKAQVVIEKHMLHILQGE